MASRVTGGGQLREIEARLFAAPGELDKAVAKHLRTVPPKVQKLVRAGAAAKMPHRGGYEATLGRALKFQSSVQVKRGLTMTTYAEGKRSRRDVPALNAGRLKHPLFGDRGVWKTTRIPPRFVSDAYDEGTKLAADAVEDALGDVKKAITK